jgi:hypothetical protein
MVTPPEVPSPTSEIMNSPSFELSPLPGTADSRLAELEARLSNREAKIDKALDTMNQTLALLARAVTTNPPPVPQTPLHSATSARSRVDLKPAVEPVHRLTMYFNKTTVFEMILISETNVQYKVISSASLVY